MVKEAADLVKRKGRRVRYSVTCLAIAAALVVIGALAARGGEMAEDLNPQSAPDPEPAAEPDQPSPPPYRPDKDLIGYIEKGQRPPTSAAPPSEKQ